MSKKIDNSIIGIRSPGYVSDAWEWEKFRLAYQGGREFIDKYLQMYSKREDVTEFAARKASTYCPAHAKTAVNEIKDSISERLVDVIRVDGPASYQQAIHGISGGVDRAGATMNGFISNTVLPELLSMGKVGVYIDRPELTANASLLDTAANPPYLYIYTREEILAWKYDRNNKLESVLLCTKDYTYDDSTSLPNGTVTTYRQLKLNAGVVTVTNYNAVGTEQMAEGKTLNIDELPFVIFEIQQSLMTDIADYQIALLNLGSSDLSYAIRSNFPFYTEQFDPRDLATSLLQAGPAVDSNGDDISPGTATEAKKAKTKTIETGAGQGRRYPKGADRPGFIHPSSEPMNASMAKQAELKAEIRELTRLSVQSLASSSSDSKKEDNRSVESGLSSIGNQLEKGERQVGKIWGMYEGDLPPVIKYPNNYTLRTDAERREEASELEKLIAKMPSVTAQKVIAKDIAKILLSHKVTKEQMDDIEKEIEESKVIITDPVVIREDLAAGLVSTETASVLRNYPKGEVAQAKIDHIERLTRIAEAQSKAGMDKYKDTNITTDMVDGITNASARGLDDASDGLSSASDEKEASRMTDEDGVVTDKTRGEGKANG